MSIVIGVSGFCNFLSELYVTITTSLQCFASMIHPFDIAVFSDMEDDNEMEIEPDENPNANDIVESDGNPDHVRTTHVEGKNLC